MTRAVGHESLDIPKFGRERLDMGRESLESLCSDFRDPCPGFHDSRLDFPDLTSSFARPKLPVRLRNLGLNLDAA